MDCFLVYLMIRTVVPRPRRYSPIGSSVAVRAFRSCLGSCDLLWV